MSFTYDLDSVKIKYIGQRSSSSNVIVRTQTRRHTHTTDYFTWTTKVVNNQHITQNTIASNHAFYTS